MTDTRTRKRKRRKLPVDNTIDEELLLRAIDIDRQLKKLQQEREEVRQLIMAVMDEASITVSCNDVCTVRITQTWRDLIRAAALKREFPELHRTIKDAGLMTHIEYRQMALYPKKTNHLKPD